MISVLLSLDKNWMMIGVVPSLRLGRSWMAVISISGMSTWSLSWAKRLKTATFAQLYGALSISATDTSN